LIAAEREQFAIERVRLRPKFSIGAGVGQENRNPVGDTLGEKTDITTVSTALNVQWSIFDGRASHHSKSASLARSRGLESELQGAMAEVSDALAESAARTEVEFSSLRINERALALARAGLDLSQADFEIGTLSRSQVEESKLNEVRAFHTATQARAEFYRAVADLLANHGTPLIEALNARESAGRLEPIASP
jgi:outer membrane protein TolC